MSDTLSFTNKLDIVTVVLSSTMHTSLLVLVISLLMVTGKDPFFGIVLA